MYSANMFEEDFAATDVSDAGGDQDAGEARRGFGSFGEGLLSRGYYNAFWRDAETDLTKLRPNGPATHEFFQAIREVLEQRLFSFDLRFSEVVARAGKEYMVLLLNAPLDRLWPQIISGKRLAFRPSTPGIIAGSQLGRELEWSLSAQALGDANGRAKNRRGFCRPVYFAVLVGTSINGRRVVVDRCYLHPVVSEQSLFATVASHEERNWLTSSPLLPDEVLYKAVAQGDFNDTMARVLSNFGYRWTHVRLLPDKIVISKEGIRISEHAGLDRDPAYVADFNRKIRQWKAITKAIPVISCDNYLELRAV